MPFTHELLNIIGSSQKNDLLLWYYKLFNDLFHIMLSLLCTIDIEPDVGQKHNLHKSLKFSNFTLLRLRCENDISFMGRKPNKIHKFRINGQNCWRLITFELRFPVSNRKLERESLAGERFDASNGDNLSSNQSFAIFFQTQHKTPIAFQVMNTYWIGPPISRWAYTDRWYHFRSLALLLTCSEFSERNKVLCFSACCWLYIQHCIGPATSVILRTMPAAILVRQHIHKWYTTWLTFPVPSTTHTRCSFALSWPWQMTYRPDSVNGTVCDGRRRSGCSRTVRVHELPSRENSLIVRELAHVTYTVLLDTYKPCGSPSTYIRIHSIRHPSGLHLYM